jgi:hypothetical protein
MLEEYSNQEKTMTEMILVFGSNEGGIHGAGAARFAYEKRGARWGTSYGLNGKSFAIPTKGFIMKREFGETSRAYVGETLSLGQIADYVTGFKAFAKGRPDLTFQVTCIGCGLAGLKHEDIAPMFEGSPSNCLFDNLWYDWLGPTAMYWGSF